jgi:hypothetical protein
MIEEALMNYLFEEGFIGLVFLAHRSVSSERRDPPSSFNFCLRNWVTGQFLRKADI